MKVLPTVDTVGFDTALARSAIAVLGRNWHGHSTVPSRRLYPHQWSWDSAFIALGLRHWAPRRAAAELLSLFGAQWDDGRVPQIVFNPAVHDDAYFPGPSFWRSDEVAGHPPVATSGIIQPPVHAVAAAAVMTQLGEDAVGFGRRIYPALVAQNAYLRRCRAGRRELAFVTHPWETGMDNSPAWDAPLAAVPADLAVFDTHTRRDLDHAGHDERPTDDDYARYIRLAAAYRDHGYDDRWVGEEGEFLVLDVGFNALWGWSEWALAELAARIGRDPRPHRAEAERITAGLVDQLYETAPDGASLFQAHDVRADRRLPERTVGGLLPLVLPGLGSSVVDGLVATLTGEAFRSGSGEVLGVPSFDLTAPAFDPQRYWRGPSWLNTTWLIGRGLEAHGRRDLAAAVLEDLLELVRRSGFREYFNPHTGTGHGIDRFSWSAALVLDVLAH
jgi:glycogen debranching enzyme